MSRLKETDSAKAFNMTRIILFIFIPMALAFMGFSLPGGAYYKGDSLETKHVILVSIDGLAAYHLENEELVLPNLRELIGNGVWAEASQTVFPSVTHPSHATLITGVSPRQHGVVGNQITNRETGESHHPTTLTRKEAIHTPTLFDAARKAGLTTASFCWPETREDSSIDYNILHGHGELDKAEVDPGLLESLREADIPIDAYYDLVSQGGMMQGFRDALLAQSAAEIFRRHQPGFMAVHFLVTDAMQHAWGPDHYLAHGALTQADHNLGLIRQAVKEAKLEEQTAFVIVADHGFHSVANEINIHPVLKDSGLADRIRLHGSGWHVMVEKTENFSEQRDGKALKDFFEKTLALEGVERIIKNDEFPGLGYPRYEESPYVLGQFIIIADIDTFLKVDDSSGSTQRRERSPSHSHGYLPDHPRMHPALVLSGYGIRKNHRIGLVRNHDVAPTIAHILGLSMTDMEGRVLRDALEK
jgi:predicted AlkP superfamily pyrophosphatase or phosphodiesterase